MNRRSFLKIAGFAAAMGNYAAARHLMLLNVSETAPISRIEWMVYATGRRSPASGPEYRCAVRIGTACGIQGWADAPSSAMPDHDTAGTIRNALLGRLENKPVHVLLGTKRQTVKACVTTGFNLGDSGQYAEVALACKETGVHGCKIHPYIEWGAGRNGSANAGFPDRDIAVYQAVRDAVGPDYGCMADNFCTYTYDEALRVGRLLDDLGYEWYESPMPEGEDWRQRYTALAGELKTPVCAPETEPDSYPPRISWIASKACDLSRIDASLGGFTACLELALACEAAGVPLTLHDLGPDSYPHVQLLGATAESLVKYLELASLSQDTRALPGRATPEPILDSEGCVAIPQTPGMGLELDWKYIYAHRAA